MAPSAKEGLIATAAIGLASLAFFAVAQRRQLKAEEAIGSGSDLKYARLTTMEETMLSLRLAPMSTATWFRGNIGEAADCIRFRVKEIVRANPWLGGSFVKSRDGHYQILYSVSETRIQNSVASMIQVLDGDKSLPRDLSYDEFAEKCSPYLLQPGKEFQQPFCKIVLAPCDEQDCFVLLMSLSHVAGDGHTKYSLYNMVVGGTAVTPLRVERLLSTSELQEKFMGKAEAAIMQSVGIIVCSIRGAILNGIGRLLDRKTLKVHSCSFLIDNEKVAQLKEEAKRGSGKFLYVSTNDIVTSWFLKNCLCEHGLMAVNMRGRMEDHAEEMAGNYENCIYYRSPMDVETPALIRHSLRDCKRVVTRDLPISSTEIAWQSYGIVTNWATFCTAKFELPDCKILKHVPVYNLPVAVPCTIVICVIYRARPGKLGVLLAGPGDKLKRLSGAPFESFE